MRPVAPPDRHECRYRSLDAVDVEAYGPYPSDGYVYAFEGLETALEQASRETIEMITETATEKGITTEQTPVMTSP
ncbi:MAG: hypothetical protein ABEH65_09545 [Halobacteriales archaeon]